MTPPINVPKEWIEGLIEAANQFGAIHVSGADEETLGENIRQAAHLSHLLGYIKSAESFLIQK